MPITLIPSPPDPATLSPAPMIDSDHLAVINFARQHAPEGTEQERAVALYYAVRDGFRYDPYHCDISAHGMKASTLITQGVGWCIPKATLLAAACRATGIPARLGFTDVRNHLSTQRMRESMKTDIFYWHGYTEIWLANAWRKATPAFNLNLCERFGLLPLEFNGEDDSIYHPFDRAGNRHMEYLAQRGSFNDVPLDQLLADFRLHYPDWIKVMTKPQNTDFLTEIDLEVANTPALPTAEKISKHSEHQFTLNRHVQLNPDQ